MDQADREARVFERLHTLCERGYKPALPARECRDTIWLESPAARAPSLTLYSDGMIATSIHAINALDKDDPNRILNTSSRDDAVFAAFVRQLPAPTWRERTADARARFIWVPLIIGGFYVACFVAAKLAIGALRATFN